MRELLLAKTSKNGIEKSVLEHTKDVVLSTTGLFGTPEKPTRLADEFSRMFKVTDISRFVRNTTVAAALHDIGKANEGFQIAIDWANQGRYPPYRQPVRHEHISAMLFFGEFGNGLREHEQLDWLAVFSAVVGHHRKTGCDDNFTDNDTLQFNTDTESFARLVQYVSDVTGIEFDESLLPSKLSAFEIRESLEDEVRAELSDADRTTPVTDPELSQMILAVRAALIIADSVGSALPAKDESISDWISAVFDETTLIQKDDVTTKIIAPRVRELEDKGGNKFEWSDFQMATAKLPDRSLLLAPCGSGKTLAAWKWIENQAVRGIRHAIFLYPTRATATEGFKDYVSWAPEAEAILMHGSARFELDSMFENPAFQEKDEPVKKDYSANASLNSFSFWKKRFFSATVDQFLAFLEWDYSSVCLLPVLADSVIIIDEVHSFDDRMFHSLIAFLDRMNVPVLCMTATLTGNRRTELQSRLTMLDAYAEHFPKLRDVDDEPRYDVHVIERDDAVGQVLAAFSQGQKVLWVVNTVSRAQQIYRELDESRRVPHELLHCYHSRFRLSDRKTHHDAVVNAFKHSAKPAVAVTTQVCEMGLDLDSDLLITEECPAASLVQRMGRCNRAMVPRDESGQILVYKPESTAPYKEDVDLIGLPELLGKMHEAGRFTQRGLNEMLNSIPQRDPDLQSICSFFQCGYIVVGDYRDIEQHTRQAILDDDVMEVRKLARARKPLDGFVLPVPRHPNSDYEEPQRPIPRYLRIAPAKKYCRQVGYRATDSMRSNNTTQVEDKKEEQWEIL